MHFPTSFITAIAPFLLLGTLSFSVLAEPEHGVREAAADEFNAPALAARHVPPVDAAAAVRRDVAEAEATAAATASASADVGVAGEDTDTDDDTDDDDDDGEEGGEEGGAVASSNSRVRRAEGTWEHGGGMEKRHWKCWWYKKHGYWRKKCGWGGGHWKAKRGYDDYGYGHDHHHHHHHDYHHGHHGHHHHHGHHGHHHHHHHGHGHY